MYFTLQTGSAEIFSIQPNLQNHQLHSFASFCSFLLNIKSLVIFRFKGYYRNKISLILKTWKMVKKCGKIQKIVSSSDFKIFDRDLALLSRSYKSKCSFPGDFLKFTSIVCKGKCSLQRQM